VGILRESRNGPAVNSGALTITSSGISINTVYSVAVASICIYMFAECYTIRFS
jgi:hypothetical protein